MTFHIIDIHAHTCRVYYVTIHTSYQMRIHGYKLLCSTLAAIYWNTNDNKNIKLQWNVEIRRIRRSSAQETTTKTKRAEGKKWNCKQQNGKDADAFAFAMDGKHLNFLVYACCSFVNQYKLSNAQAYTAIPWNMIIDRYAYKYNHGKLWRSSIGLLSVFIASNAYFSIPNEM